MSNTQSTALTVIERAKQALKVSPEFEKELRELAQASVTITTITNDDGRTQVHAARMALKNRRIELETDAETAREDSNAFSRAVIAEQKRLIALIQPEEKRLQALQDAHDAKAEAEKQRKADAELQRVEGIRSRIDNDIRGAVTGSAGRSAEQIATTIADVERISIDESFAEFSEQAREARIAAIAGLRQLHTSAVASEAAAVQLAKDRAELAELRAAQEKRNTEERERLAEVERQAQAARAAEQARLDAVRAEEDARQAEARRLEREEQDRLATERADFEARQAEAEKIRADAEAHKAEVARLAALTKPSDVELIGVLAAHYNAPHAKVIDWILAMDLSQPLECVG